MQGTSQAVRTDHFRRLQAYVTEFIEQTNATLADAPWELWSVVAFAAKEKRQIVGPVLICGAFCGPIEDPLRYGVVDGTETSPLSIHCVNVSMSLCQCVKVSSVNVRSCTNLIAVCFFVVPSRTSSSQGAQDVVFDCRCGREDCQRRLLLSQGPALLQSGYLHWQICPDFLSRPTELGVSSRGQ